MPSTDTTARPLPEKWIGAGHSRGGRKLNPEYVALWESYLDEGMHYTAVGDIFGVSAETVRTYYPGRGWTHEQVSAHGTYMRHHNQKMRKVLAKSY